ncbi:MAG TPA: SGNH/GDSL hydrolase family protein, partial [Bacillota bacterium]|nr:SGNH/GDSL hydrolase family protein [Bacillota bacterium]
MSIRILLALMAICGSVVASSGQTAYHHDATAAEELRVRDGLPNFLVKLEAGGSVRIAYLGGSITAANGWRPKTLAWFKSQFPKAEVIEINAAISGTGSDYGACRIATDVLTRNPDLVFMEHRVNGGGGFEAQSIEGIVRQIWQSNPRTDICLVYTIGPWMRKDLESGKTPGFGAIMERVANAYGIPSIDLGIEIAKREREGVLIFQTNTPVAGKLVFSSDGVHPGDAGHDVYRDVIARSMLVMKAEAKAKAHSLPTPLNPRCWETASLLAITNATLSPGWTAVDPAKDSVYRDDFGRTDGMLRGAVKCDRTGETITVRWHGTTLGFSDIP